MAAFFPFARNWLSLGVAGPSKDSVRPTTLMTAVRVIDPSGSRSEHRAGFSAHKSQRPFVLPGLQFLDRFEHDGVVHLMHLESCADAFEQRDRQLATEMFPELLQAFEDDKVAAGIHVQQLVGK